MQTLEGGHPPGPTSGAAPRGSLGALRDVDSAPPAFLASGVPHLRRGTVTPAQSRALHLHEEWINYKAGMPRRGPLKNGHPSLRTSPPEDVVDALPDDTVAVTRDEVPRGWLHQQISSLMIQRPRGGRAKTPRRPVDTPLCVNTVSCPPWLGCASSRSADLVPTGATLHWGPIRMLFICTVF